MNVSVGLTWNVTPHPCFVSGALQLTTHQYVPGVLRYLGERGGQCETCILGKLIRKFIAFEALVSPSVLECFDPFPSASSEYGGSGVP
jgi:hypothetical protein